ncbi:MAG: hypothetical protein RRY34_01150 [Victivallaceae bacterium]
MSESQCFNNAPESPQNAPAPEQEIISTLKNALKNSESQQLSLQQKYDSLIRRRNVEQLATKHKFADVDYLDFLLNKEQIPSDNAECCDNFINTLRQKAPRYFNNELKSGGGTRLNLADRSEFIRAVQSGNVDDMLRFAPEI